MEEVNIFIEKYKWLVIVVIVWTIFWKGFALWKSARRGEKIWFIVFLFLNTIGILEILYLFVFSEKTSVALEIPPKKEIV